MLLAYYYSALLMLCVSDSPLKMEEISSSGHHYAVSSTITTLLHGKFNTVSSTINTLFVGNPFYIIYPPISPGLKCGDYQLTNSSYLFTNCKTR